MKYQFKVCSRPLMMAFDLQTRQRMWQWVKRQLASAIDSEDGLPRHRLMALAYGLVGLPLCGFLATVGGDPDQILLLGAVIALAVAVLSVPALKNRFTDLYATAIVPAVVCGLSSHIAGAQGSFFSTFMMATVGLSSLHSRASTVIVGWVSVTIAWCFLLLPRGESVADVVILSWVYAVAAAMLYAKARRMRGLHLELEEKALAAHAATRAKNQFLAGMSHELRTPLNGVIGMTDIALNGPLTLEQRDTLETIRSSADWLLATVSAVLEFARAESGRIIIQDVPWNPRAVVDELMKMLAPAAYQKSLELIVDIDPLVPLELRGDGFRVRQVVSHLVGNAIKFTERGSITLRMSYDRSILLVTVEDTGIGISPEDQTRIFEAFTQVDERVSRRFDGTGLGLTLAREFVTRMGGSLAVTSMQGEGSVFSFVVPAPQVAPVPARRVLEGQTCSVVSPSPVAKQAIENLLRFHGVEITTADQPSLVIIDVPARDPHDFLKTLPSSGIRAVALVSPFFQPTTEFERLGVVSIALKPGSKSLVETLVKARSYPTPTPVVVPPAPVLTLAAPPTLKPASSSTFTCRALIAEDNPVNAKVLVRLLDRLGVQCEVVINGAECVRRAEELQFDVIFMDINMPEMDGFEAARQLRARGHREPIIAVTASDDEQQCLSSGMNSYLPKPVNAKKLEELMRNSIQVPRVAQA